MRKVVYSLTSSLDNFIARTDGAADWILMGEEIMNEFPKFFELFDTVLIGRKTYDIAYSHSEETGAEQAGFMGMETFVFSRTMKESPSEALRLVSENAGEFVRGLKRKSGKDIWLMGGGDLAASLFKEDLVDEISVAIQPVILGSGIPLFPEVGKQINLKLKESRPYRNGVVSLSYKVKRPRGRVK
ncbi:MAG TPA: dihydrofolate reductase family protein [Blastocatellia bacterium]|nr:dihydrofolate reductase family protein [Blastocatellia bacterium]